MKPKIQAAEFCVVNVDLEPIRETFSTYEKALDAARNIVEDEDTTDTEVFIVKTVAKVTLGRKSAVETIA